MKSVLRKTLNKLFKLNSLSLSNKRESVLTKLPLLFRNSVLMRRERLLLTYILAKASRKSMITEVPILRDITSSVERK